MEYVECTSVSLYWKVSLSDTIFEILSIKVHRQCQNGELYTYIPRNYVTDFMQGVFVRFGSMSELSYIFKECYSLYPFMHTNHWLPNGKIYRYNLHVSNCDRWDLGWYRSWIWPINSIVPYNIIVSRILPDKGCSTDFNNTYCARFSEKI